jgi:methylenetetrahydrofolate dehydrogenase (NAD+)
MHAAAYLGYDVTCTTISPANFSPESTLSRRVLSSLSARAAMSTASAPGKGVLLKAEPLAGAFRDELRAALARRPAPPTLVGILSTSAAPSRFYAEFTQKQCAELGVRFVLRRTGAALDDGAAEGDGVEEAIIEANEDDAVDGIMVRHASSGVSTAG